MVETAIDKGMSDAGDMVYNATMKALKKHGAQFDQDIFLRLSIITEEVGECAHAALELRYGTFTEVERLAAEYHLYEEIADVSASARLVLAQLLGERKR